MRELLSIALALMAEQRVEVAEFDQVGTLAQQSEGIRTSRCRATRSPTGDRHRTHDGDVVGSPDAAVDRQATAGASNAACPRSTNDI
jgi:hypothetical protein